MPVLFRTHHDPRDVSRTCLAALSCGVTCVLVFACDGSTEPKATSSSGSEIAPVRPAPAKSAPAQPATAPPAAELEAHMQASFWEAIRVRDALIEGDLPVAKRAADALAHQDFESVVPSDWTHWTRRIQQYARELTMAPNLGAAAQELGRIALECGECHEVRHGGPAHVRTQPEPWRDPPESLDERMLRHQVGADQMWAGLVTPSEEAFRSGTITLTRAPLVPPDRQGATIDVGLNTRIEEVRELAKQARLATTYAERGRVYGELVARCAGCHFYMRPAE